jgi:hypothetical protein
VFATDEVVPPVTIEDSSVGRLLEDEEQAVSPRGAPNVSADANVSA